MTRVTIRKPILRPFGCPDGVRVASGVSQVFTAFVTSLAGSLGVVSAPNRHKPETVPSGLKGQVEETVAITSLRSHQVVAIRIKSRRSFPATGQGILPWLCLHASTKCRPQSATPRGLPYFDSITTTRYGTSLHWPQWSYACTRMWSSPIQGLTHPRMLSPGSGVQLPPFSVITFMETMLNTRQRV
jgi:hypothetical protein